MNSKRLPLLLVILLSHVTAQIEIDGYVKNYDAVRLNEGNDYLMLRNRLRLNINYAPSEHAFGYASFDVKNDQIGEHNALEMNLREIYIDLYFGNVDLRIGKQQIVWGEADGLFITDIVNPLDLREFILADFEDIRMAVKSVKAKVYWGNQSLEGVWIPDFVPARFSPPGELWSFRNPLDEILQLFPDTLIELTDSVKPEKRLKNSEYGFRYSTLIKGLGLTVSYFRTWDDYPIFRQTYQYTGSPLTPIRIKTTPSYDRITVFGGAFSSTAGPFVLRGEGALYRNKNFYVEEPAGENRVGQRDLLNYMLGGELSPGDAFISGQFVQELILDYADQLMSDERVNMGTLLISHTFINEIIKPEIFMIYNFTHEDYWTRISMKYYPVDGMEIILAVDILGGKDANTLFGQFENNDNIFLKVKYSF